MAGSCRELLMRFGRQPVARARCGITHWQALAFEYARAARRRNILMYRAGAGRRSPLRKLTIGRHGSPWTPDTARTEAKPLLGIVVSGGDPAAVKTQRRKALTVADLAQRFIDEHAKAKRKTRTATEYGRLIDRIILPVLGKKKIIDLSRADVIRLHHGTPLSRRHAASGRREAARDDRADH